MIAAALKHMFAAGMSQEAIIAAVEDMEASKPDRETHPDIEAAEAKRARDRDRMRECRATSRDGRATPHTPRVKKLNINNPPTPLLATFCAWYAEYPKRRGRGAAEKAYTKALREGATTEDLLDGAKRYAAEVRGREEQFIAFPATWLNQKRWLDEPDKPKGGSVIPMSGRLKVFEPSPPKPNLTPEQKAEVDAKIAQMKARFR